MERVMKRPEMEMGAEMPIESKEVEKKRKDKLDRKDRDPRVTLTTSARLDAWCQHSPGMPGLCVHLSSS